MRKPAMRTAGGMGGEGSRTVADTMGGRNEGKGHKAERDGGAGGKVVPASRFSGGDEESLGQDGTIDCKAEDGGESVGPATRFGAE